MDEQQQPAAAPNAAEFFEICAQMLAVCQSLHETTERQAVEIRLLIAELHAELR